MRGEQKSKRDRREVRFEPKICLDDDEGDRSSWSSLLLGALSRPRASGMRAKAEKKRMSLELLSLRYLSAQSWMVV